MELIGHDSVPVDRSHVHTSPDAMRNARPTRPVLAVYYLFAFVIRQQSGDFGVSDLQNACPGGIDVPTIERVIAGLQKSTFLTIDAAGKVTYQNP